MPHTPPYVLQVTLAGTLAQAQAHGTQLAAQLSNCTETKVPPLHRDQGAPPLGLMPSGMSMPRPGLSHGSLVPPRDPSDMHLT